jgi:phosphoribosylanthranilate isomerase
MTLVKICGITNLKDALGAAEAGADCVGFNFYSLSPRFVLPETARSIINQLPSSLLTVGVFVNESLAEVTRIVNETGVKAIQLHGDESPAYCESLSDRYLIKAFSVNSDFDLSLASTYKVNAVMLDGFDKSQRGGTGRVFDWKIAQEAKHNVPKLFLAGGLSPENVVEAIETVRPYAVDACSSLETTPGKKNLSRVVSFIKLAHDR